MNESIARPVCAETRQRAAVEHHLNKHQQKTQETRRALLDAARRIFARDGFQACRLEDVAAAAGHTRGAFYANFDTKEDLFFALLQEDAEKHARQIRAAMAGGKTVRERLSALREHYVQGMADRTWAMLLLELQLFAVRHPKLRAKMAAALRRIRASMKLDDVEDLLGMGDKRLTESTRAVLEALFTGLCLQHTFDPERLSERQAGHFLGTLFDSLLQPPASKS